MSGRVLQPIDRHRWHHHHVIFNINISISYLILTISLCYRRVFRRMDDDGSRSLGYEEFKNGIAESGLNVSDESSKELFDEFDKDGSGTVSVDEFLRAIRVSPWNNFIVEFSFFFFFFFRIQIQIQKFTNEWMELFSRRCLKAARRSSAKRSRNWTSPAMVSSHSTTSTTSTTSSTTRDTWGTFH